MLHDVFCFSGGGLDLWTDGVYTEKHVHPQAI